MLRSFVATFRSIAPGLVAFSLVFGTSQRAGADGFTRNVFPRPDLRIEREGASTCQTHAFTFKIVNSGKAPAGTFRMRVFVDGRASELEVRALAPGESRSFSFPAHHPEWGLAAHADVTNVVNESDETNNQITGGCPRPY